MPTNVPHAPASPSCRGCEKPLRSDCQYCSLRCKVDVQYGRAPHTPDVTGLDVQQPRCERLQEMSWLWVGPPGESGGRGYLE